MRAAALALALLMTAVAPAHAEPMQVLVVKRAGVTAYEEVAEEFAERCRVRARVISFADEGVHGLRLSSDDLVVTVGQEALDALHGTKAHVVPTLAFHAPEGLVGPPVAPHPELILKVLAMARGSKIHVVGVVYGPRSTALVNQAARAGSPRRARRRARARGSARRTPPPPLRRPSRRRA